jgi:tRNA threonylcarbamoyladenosine biosynthesis protein TsaE
MAQYLSNSAEETFTLGRAFGKQLPPNSIVCFYGDLGAGKTTFIKGLASGLLNSSGEEINSPTFTYLNIYQNEGRTLYHFDLYRLHDADEFLAMGFDEMFEAGGVCCIEWAEKLAPLQLPSALRVELHHLGEDHRRIEITSW